MQRQHKAPPPLRVEPIRPKNVRRPKDITFSEALHKLKRGFKVKRANWGNLHLEIRSDFKGEREIVEVSTTSTQMVRHKFDHVEIMANDWMVL